MMMMMMMMMLMMMLTMKIKRIFGMWSLAIHRAYREDSDLSLYWAHMRYSRNCCAPAHMSYGGKLATFLLASIPIFIDPVKYVEAST